MPALGIAIGIPVGFGPRGGGGEASLFLHILVGGQSFAVGVGGNPIVSDSQPYSNVMFAGGTRAALGTLGSVTPLIETSETDPVDESQTDDETVCSSIANEIFRTTARKIIMSVAGKSGQIYNNIKKGTTTYNLGISQVTAAQAAVFSTLGRNVEKTLCVVILHGESDQAFDVPDYNLHLAEWQSDFNTDIKAATGQSADVPIFIYQQCGASPSAASSVAVATALKSLQAARANPTKIILVTPNFLWLRSDTIHLFGHGYRSMGCMFSRVIKKVMIDNTPWLPFAPSSITRVGATIDCVFDVPEPPLAFDLVSVLNPGNYGFTYKDDNDDTTISSVSLLNATTVRIVLSGTPTGANKRLRYGFTQTATGSGPFISGRGNLCDSGATANAYGYKVPMKNWACLFDDPIPYP